MFESRVWTPILNCYFTIFRVLILCPPICSEVCLESLTKRNHFKHVGGVDPNLLFSLWKTIPAFTGTNEEHQACLIKGAASMLQELISDGRFESNDHHQFSKPVFLFGDAIKEDEEILFDGNYKWFHQIREYRFFLPNMERMFPLSCLHPRLFPDDWDLVRAQSGIAIGRISNSAAFSVGHSREVLALFPNSMK